MGAGLGGAGMPCSRLPLPGRCATWPVVNLKLRDLGRTPYVLYGVKNIDLVSLGKKGERC